MDEVKTYKMYFPSFPYEKSEDAMPFYDLDEAIEFSENRGDVTDIKCFRSDGKYVWEEGIVWECEIPEPVLAPVQLTIFDFV